MDPRHIDPTLSAVRAGTYASGLLSLAQAGTKAGSVASAKAIGLKAPVINAAIGGIEAVRLANSPALRAQRTAQLESAANAGPLQSLGMGTLNPVGTIFGFGKLLHEMLQSQSNARLSKLNADNAQARFNSRH